MAQKTVTPRLGDLVKAGQFGTMSWFCGEVVAIGESGRFFDARDHKGRLRGFDTEHASEYRLTGNVNDEARDRILAARGE